MTKKSEHKKHLTDLKRAITKLNSKKELHLGFGLVDPIEYIETPFVTLNSLVGGGFPRGKFTTLAGAERTAKGTLLLQTIGYNMSIDPEFTVLWTDAENALDEEWCVMHGVDLSRVIVQKYSEDAQYFERLLDDGMKLIETGAIDMWVIDSVGGLLPKAEADKDIEGESMLNLQRKLGLFFRKNIRVVSQAKVATIMIGQIYEAPNTSYVDIRVKGGNALKHWAHLRLMTRRGNQKEVTAGKIKVMTPDGETKDIMSGWSMHVKVDKTRLNGNEGQSVMLQFVLGRGIDSIDSAITALLAHDTFEVRGGWFYNDKLHGGKIQGKDNLINLLKADEALRDEMIQELDKELVATFSEAIKDTDQEVSDKEATVTN